MAAQFLAQFAEHVSFLCVYKPRSPSLTGSEVVDSLLGLPGSCPFYIPSFIPFQ